MGFFGVLKPLMGEQQNVISSEQFEVQRLDINLWILPTLFGGTTLLCDVGIRINSITDVSCFDVSLPFRLATNQIIDLKDVISDQSTASLVFGTDIRDDPDSDYYILKGLTGRPLGSPVSKTLTVVRVTPQIAMAPGELGYFRFRTEIGSAARLMAWRRSMLGRTQSILIDVRVSDLREAAFVPNTLQAEQRMQDIMTLNCLVIASAKLRSIRFNPELRYVRILEGSLWERYMSRALDLTRREKYVVYFWRSQQAVRPGNEFRGFLELANARDYVSVAWLTAWVIILVLLVADGHLFVSSPWGRLIVNGKHSFADAWHSYKILAAGVTGLVGIFAIVTLAFRASGRVPGWYRRTRGLLKKLSVWIYHKRGEY